MRNKQPAVVYSTNVIKGCVKLIGGLVNWQFACNRPVGVRPCPESHEPSFHFELAVHSLPLPGAAPNSTLQSEQDAQAPHHFPFSVVVADLPWPVSDKRHCT